MNDVLSWLAVTIELIGLSLIALELYMPKSMRRLTQALDAPNAGTGHETQATKLAIGIYVGVWVLGGIVIAFWDPGLTITFNVAMTLFTLVFATIVFVLARLVRIGVIVGRGNSIGGIGLVLALIGFTLEVSQLL